MSRLGLEKARVTELPRPGGHVAVSKRGTGGGTLVGTVQDRNRGVPPRSRVESVRPVVVPTRRADAAGRPLVRVQRQFRVGGAPDVRPRRAPAGPDPKAVWEEFRATGEQQVEGRLVDKGRAVELNRLSVPGPDGTFSTTVRLVPDDRPLVDFSPVPATARVLLVAEGDGFVGSSTAAIPLTVAEFAALATGESRPTGRNRPLQTPVPVHYVGHREDPDGAHHVFSWGRGWSRPSTGSRSPHRRGG